MELQQSPAASAGSPPAHRRSLIVALVIGLVIGGGGVGAVWVLRDDSSGGVDPTAAGPVADARAACHALDGFDESKYAIEGPEGDIALNRWGAAGALSAAAAAGDARYKLLAQAIRRSQDRHAQAFQINDEVKKELAEARRICEGL
ncbi:hypothetical protein [Streptomyces sp. WMMC940]|uniref:hypothetical protein n=1 Tax=Streptomyces sp. WMMC940 TaxID=3015153 RepID=UPI0022B64F39|nr:hypothetical protein [Streptomyces sp. WMMC940]MCZ7457645.1 hypothetical protein [Streptomyces sp. WMMC940]